jgi:hypothetical protein
MRAFRPVTLILFFAVSGAVGQQSTGPVPSDRSQPPKPLSTNPLIVEADRWYGRRQEGRVGARAAAGPINQAIAGYEEAARDPDFVEPRWKLARALYFKGIYTGLDEDSKKAVFQKAKRVSDDAIAILGASLEKRGIKGFLDFGPELLAGNLKDRSDAAPSYFWAAVSWGEWALAVGKVEAAKTGAAEKVRDDGLTVIGIDHDFEEGGGYRVVGRLHDQAPWIPFITGWVSHSEAIKYLRLAMQVNNRNFVNRHFLAEALYHGDAKERAEGIALEEALLADAPSPQHLVEEIKIQEDARQNLSVWKRAS